MAAAARAAPLVAAAATLANPGSAPEPAFPAALAAAETLLLACAAQPFPVRKRGTLSKPALRRLLPRLEHLSLQPADLAAFTWSLLLAQGMVAGHTGRATITPAGTLWLAAPADERLERLRTAWIALPDVDPILAPLLVDRRGIDWPFLRRRLIAWVAALPDGQLIDSTVALDTLISANGPLADAHTHGFRRVSRTPWGPKRTHAIWHAGLSGPLHWLGYVDYLPHSPNDSTPHAVIARIGSLSLPADDRPWQYGDPGEVIVPTAAGGAALGQAVAGMRWMRADTNSTIYRVDPQSLAQATRAAVAATTIEQVIRSRAGDQPPGWRLSRALEPATVEVSAGLVLTAPPGVLEQAARARSVRRYITRRLAPGVITIDAADAETLTRVLERQGVAVVETTTDGGRRTAAVRPQPDTGHRHSDRDQKQTTADDGRRTAVGKRQSELNLNDGERAALALACAYLRAQAPHAGLALSANLERRLEAGLSNALRTGLSRAAQELGIPGDPQQATPWEPLRNVEYEAQQAEHTQVPDSASWHIGQLTSAQAQRCIAARRQCDIRYRDAAGDEQIRRIRPLDLYRKGGRWYLSAYCTLAEAERTFRLDRVVAVRG
ncbi:MAG: WYL domain-containing protein [Oscillochloris sp.]|nr:WYL domain-containing protein [Oscillochloris sp.]